MTAQLIIDQVGLPPGVPNQARSDGLNTGALVTLTSAGQGISHNFELLWAPDDDTTAFNTFQKINATTATFSPDPASLGGSYRIKLTVVQDTGTYEVIRIFSVLTSQGLRIPALNEQANEGATLATGPSLVAYSEFNEPSAGRFSTGNYGGWFSALADLVRYVDTLSGGGGGGSGDVIGPSSSVNDHIVTFNGNTGKLIKDGGQTIASVLSSAASTAATTATTAAQNEANIRTALGNATANISVNSHKITNVSDPTSAQDAATKGYVDTHASGGMTPAYYNGYNEGGSVPGTATTFTGVVGYMSGGTHTDAVVSGITRSGSDFTVTNAGVYRVMCQINTYATSGITRMLRAIKNGTTSPAAIAIAGYQDTGAVTMVLDGLISCAAGDTITLQVCFQSTASTFGVVTVNGQQNRNLNISIVRVA